MLFPFFCTYDKIYPKNIHRYEREVHAFMDITMLGTGNAMVTECYNPPVQQPSPSDNASG